MEYDKTLQQLKKSLEVAENELQRAKQLFRELEADSAKKSYKDIPGVEGVFDGYYMVTDSGEKHEVPSNYAAKTKILYGDRLKMLEEEGKTVFKNISKQPRKKLDGVLNKKEGKWYVLTEKGTYRVSDNCVEFNEFKVNDRVVVLVPENNLNAPFAAIESEKRSEVMFVKTVSAPSMPPRPQVVIQPSRTQQPPSRPHHSTGGPSRAPRPTSGPKPQKDSRKEFVSDITTKTNTPKPQAPSPTPARTLDEEDLR